MSETIIVAIITACATTIPNIAIALINNRYQFKNKLFESHELARRNALANFNDKASSYYSITLTKFRMDYEQALNDLYAYFPYINDESLNDLENARHLNNWNEYYLVLRKVIKQLSKSIRK